MLSIKGNVIVRSCLLVGGFCASVGAFCPWNFAGRVFVQGVVRFPVKTSFVAVFLWRTDPLLTCHFILSRRSYSAHGIVIVYVF